MRVGEGTHRVQSFSICGATFSVVSRHAALRCVVLRCVVLRCVSPPLVVYCPLASFPVE
jgi:hypothetical protein